MVMDENLVEEKPLGRPRLRWEDVIIKYCSEALNGGQGKHERLIGKAIDNWMCDGMVLMADKPKNNNKKKLGIIILERIQVQ